MKNYQHTIVSCFEDVKPTQHYSKNLDINLCRFQNRKTTVWNNMRMNKLCQLRWNLVVMLSIHWFFLGLNIYNHQVCTNKEKEVSLGTQQAVYFAPGQQLNSDQKSFDRDSNQQPSWSATCHLENTNYHAYWDLIDFRPPVSAIITSHTCDIKTQLCY